jgi:hypothetical protein
MLKNIDIVIIKLRLSLSNYIVGKFLEIKF